MAETRTVDEERAECLAANRGGLSFLLVHGVTWTAAAALSYALPLKAAALLYLFQGLVAFPASLAVERALGLRTLSGKDNSLVNLFVLIAMSQGLALPASIVAYSLDPRYLPVVFAATSAGHFLAYAWLYRTSAYALLAVVAAFGPFVLLVVTGPDATFHSSGFLLGAALLITAGYLVRLTSERNVARTGSASPGSS